MLEILLHCPRNVSPLLCTTSPMLAALRAVLSRQRKRSSATPRFARYPPIVIVLIYRTSLMDYGHLGTARNVCRVLGHANGGTVQMGVPCKWGYRANGGVTEYPSRTPNLIAPVLRGKEVVRAAEGRRAC